MKFIQTNSISQTIVYLTRISIVLLGFVMTTGQVIAQQISQSQWFFGNSEANMQFDKNGELVYEEMRMTAPFGMGGPAVINSSLTGNLLLYTDGQNAYDAKGELIESALTGDPEINQAAVASPTPSNPSQYLVFTNGGPTGNISYAVFNIDLPGNGSPLEPLGDFVSINNTTSLLNPSEGLIVVRSSLPGFTDRYWLISQNSGTFDFMVSPITDNGIDESAIQTFSFDNLTDRPGIRAAQMAYNSDSALLAIAPQNASRNVWLLNFNDTSGVLTFDRQILNTGHADDAGENIYDLEWSVNGSKLYMSRYGSTDSTTANVYRFDLSDSLQTVTALRPNTYRSYGLQRGIDDRIYHLYQDTLGGPYLVGRFSFTDSAFMDFHYEAQYFDTDFNGRQFPAFSPGNFHGFNELGFTYIDFCQNDNTKFFPLVDPMPTRFEWNFGDGFGSQATAPIYAYQEPSGYIVGMTVELDGIEQTYFETVIIASQEEELDLGQDTVICPGEPPWTLSANVPGAVSYLWNDGSSGQSVEIDSAGTYWVSVELAGGCRVFDDKVVTEYGVQEQIQNQWYFGEMAGIDFNENPAVAITDENMMFSEEGCASISNADGELLFYTNGSTVWNKDHQIMSTLENGFLVQQSATSIGGDSTAAQGVMILPFADDYTMYYIFTAAEVEEAGDYHMSYSIVDLKYDSAQGAVTQRNLPFFSNSLEKVSVDGFTAAATLVSHELGNNSFRTNLVTSGGIGETIFTPLGEVIHFQDPEQASGYMKFGPGAQLLANTIPGQNVIELFNFIDSSGRFDEPLQIETGETQDIYGLEFAPGGLRLYVSTRDKIIQYDLDSLGTPDAKQHIEDSKYDGYPTTPDHGAIQRGPDGVLYIARDGITSLATLNAPDQDDDAAAYNSVGFDLLGRTSRLGLPNFTQNIGTPQQPPGYSFTNACFATDTLNGQGTTFLASGTSVIDEYFWDFDIFSDTTSTPPAGNGQESFTQYRADGAYIFELNITNRCGFDTLFTDTVTVFEIPDPPIFPEDEESLCNGPLELVAWDTDDPFLNYWWSTGDTSRSIIIEEVPTPRTVYAAIITDDGCISDTLGVFIGDNRPFVDLGPDRLFCEQESVPAFDAQNEVDVLIQWTIDGLDASDTRYQAVNTQTPGDYLYTVQVTEQVTTSECFTIDTVNVTVQPGPQAITSFTPPSFCGASDALIYLELPESGSYQYTFTGANIGTGGQIDGPDTIPPIGLVPAGTYVYGLTNLVTGCSLDYPVLVDDETPFRLTARNLPDCDVDVKLGLNVSGTVVPDMVNMYITTLALDTVPDPLFDLPVPITVSPPLDSGVYIVTIQDVVDGCFSSDSVLIEPYIPGETDCEPEIYAPNAFSPNGNGQNEEFFVYPNPFVDSFEIFIYSKWGELVYYSDDQNFRWDGTFSNQSLGPGMFAYIIKYTSLEEPELGVLTQYGSVTIIR